MAVSTTVWLTTWFPHVVRTQYCHSNRYYRDGCVVHVIVESCWGLEIRQVTQALMHFSIIYVQAVCNLHIRAQCDNNQNSAVQTIMLLDLLILIYPAPKFSSTRGPVRTSGFHPHSNPGDDVGCMSAQATVRNAYHGTINGISVVQCAEHGHVARHLIWFGDSQADIWKWQKKHGKLWILH